MTFLFRDMNLKRTRFVYAVGKKYYRLASTSRKIAMKFLKEIKVIFFVESSKKGCGTKIGHLSGLRSSDT